MAGWLVLGLVCWAGLCAGQAGPVGIRVNGRLLADTARVISPTQTAKLMVELQQTPGDSNLYAYRLTGNDATWARYRQATIATWYQLPGGTYELEIRAESDSKPVRQLNILITEQVVQRWWFLPSIYLFAFLLLASALYLSYLYQLHQQMRLQAVRDRIARDLHDDMGSSLSSISILSQTAARHPEQAEQTLTQIQQPDTDEKKEEQLADRSRKLAK